MRDDRGAVDGETGEASLPGRSAGSEPATEQRHPLSMHLEEMSTIELLELLNAEDRRAMDAVAAVLPSLAALVDDAAERAARGGRVHYFGAGTSGRLGVLDAAELVPTFGTDPSRVQAHIAGGAEAIHRAVENSEDSDEDGQRDALAAVGPDDVAIGLTVSGTTQYVRGALRAARERGALTAIVTSNRATPLAQYADHVIAADTGPEVLTGSTRLKAGTATKILLNGFSTALMVRLGRTYSNLMVAVVATNQKLRARTLRILGEVTGYPREQAAELLDLADGDLRVAVVSAVAGVAIEEARAALAETDGSVRDAIRRLPAEPR